MVVATDGFSTGAGASVIIQKIRIITGFVAIHPSCEITTRDPIPTDGFPAKISACIVRCIIAVIAGFKSTIVFAQIRAHNAIATKGQSAGVPTAIEIYGVTIITFFIVGIVAFLIQTPDPITADSPLTNRRAGICIDVVAVIASFLRINNAIAALWRAAIISAGIGLIIIAVITGLVTVLTLQKVAAHKTVAANSLHTRIGAGITIVDIAVVAGFTQVENTIATKWDFGTRICGCHPSVATVPNPRGAATCACENRQTQGH